MNRAIKFRAWNIIKKRYIYSDNRDLETELFRLSDFFKELMSLGEYNVTLHQFTGFRDKNGTEIFEGDILRERDNDKDLIVERQSSGLWVADSKKGYIDYVLNIHIISEVVGHVYEQSSDN